MACHNSDKLLHLLSTGTPKSICNALLEAIKPCPTLLRNPGILVAEYILDHLVSQRDQHGLTPSLFREHLAFDAILKLSTNEAVSQDTRDNLSQYVRYFPGIEQAKSGEWIPNFKVYEHHNYYIMEIMEQLTDL